VTSDGVSVMPAVRKEMPYKVPDDFTWVIGATTYSYAFAVNAERPYKTLKEMIDFAKANPGKLRFATAAHAGGGHLFGALIEKVAGIQMTHVPYKGGAGQMIPGIIGNEVQFMFINMASALPHIRTGRIRALAITTPERRPELPNVPTTAESGFPGVGTNAWNGLFAPAGIPKARLNRIYSDVVKVMETPAMKEQLSKVFMSVVINKSPEEYQKFVLQEIKSWGKIVTDNHITIE
jgi:tripartite-type tricarboxylate transporter receptor subunit TctC